MYLEEGSILKTKQKEKEKKWEDRGHICLWKGKNAASKITSRGIIYHCSLYHFFWQRQMAWSQIGSLLVFFGIFARCAFWVYVHARVHLFSHTYAGGDRQLAMSAKWTSAFDNEPTSFERMIIAETELKSMNSCKVVNLSSDRLRGIFKPVFSE